MKTLKGWITTTCLATMLMFSTVSTHAGIIIGGRPSQPVEVCTEKVEITTADDLGGIIIGGLTGIIIGGLTGIIIGGITADQPQTNCGIIIGG